MELRLFTLALQIGTQKLLTNLGHLLELLKTALFKLQSDHGEEAVKSQVVAFLLNFLVKTINQVEQIKFWLGQVKVLWLVESGEASELLEWNLLTRHE